MPKKPSAINASTLLATKEKAPVVASGALQRGQTATSTFVDMNFKVPLEFRDRFQRAAFEARLKYVQVLVRAFELWEKKEAQAMTARGRKETA